MSLLIVNVSAGAEPYLTCYSYFTHGTFSLSSTAQTTVEADDLTVLFSVISVVNNSRSI